MMKRTAKPRKTGYDSDVSDEEWAFVAGAQINGVTEKVWVKDGKLFVQIRSAAWRQQLHMQRGQWCAKLNAELEGDVIDEIVFR